MGSITGTAFGRMTEAGGFDAVTGGATAGAGLSPNSLPISVGIGCWIDCCAVWFTGVCDTGLAFDGALNRPTSVGCGAGAGFDFDAPAIDAGEFASKGSRLRGLACGRFVGVRAEPANNAGCVAGAAGDADGCGVPDSALLSGFVSAMVKIAPVPRSFTSVKYLPSGSRSVFNTCSLRSGCPAVRMVTTFSVFAVLPGWYDGVEATAEPAQRTTAATAAFHSRRVMCLSLRLQTQNVSAIPVARVETIWRFGGIARLVIKATWQFTGGFLRAKSTVGARSWWLCRSCLSSSLDYYCS
jgi:hypothetical protein